MRSMTGCGNSRISRDGWEVSVEIKTVNHRFLDISMRLPRNISFLEPVIRQCISDRIHRGHADVFLTVRHSGESSLDITPDYQLAEQYVRIAGEMSKRTGAGNDLCASNLMKMEGVLTLTEKEMDQDTVSGLCREAAGNALELIISMREKEGMHLQEDLNYHLGEVEKLRTQILQRAPGVVEDYRKRLENRLKKLNADGVEPQRLAQEVALTADRCAIDEELARLDSHIRQMRIYLQENNEIGKKMDFLIQEMNREANTIGSKASDATIAQMIVDLKSEIEKMREQIQNVE